MKHYLVIESESKEALALIRKYSHLVAEARPEANITDMLYPGDRDDYYWGYNLRPGALREDREEIAAIYRSLQNHAREVAKLRVGNPRA